MNPAAKHHGLRSALLGAAILAFSSSPAVRAEDAYDSTTFRPALGGDGIIGTAGARLPTEHDQILDLKLWGVGDHAPLSIGNENVYNRFRGVISLQAKLADGFALGVQVPMILNQHSGLNGAFGGARGEGATGAGDPRLVARWQLLTQDRTPLNLALQGAVEGPLAGKGTLSGDHNPKGEALVAASKYWGEAAGSHFELIGNLLFGARNAVNVSGATLGGTYLGARVGGAYYLGEELLRRVFAEIDGRTYTDDFGAKLSTPVEARGGVSFCFGRFIALDLAGGAAVIAGAGAPDWHVIAGLGYSPTTCKTSVPPPPPPSPAEVAAQKAAEEAAAKLAAERAAAEKAAADKLAADKLAAERAAAEKAAAEKLAAEKAAAEAAAKKAAAEEAARRAEEEAARKDTDGDGVPDRIDNCPTEKGPASNFGCPLAKKQKVAVREGKIEILDKVQFAAGKAAILKTSFPLLDQVAGVLKAHPEIEKVEVQGHTDSVGAAAKNLKLSQDRAQAVADYLGKKGVAKEVLSAKGYGETQPIADNKTKAGQEQNRRVEFKVTAMKKAAQ